jgi:hypothetical protein
VCLTPSRTLGGLSVLSSIPPPSRRAARVYITRLARSVRSVAGAGHLERLAAGMGDALLDRSRYDPTIFCGGISERGVSYRSG